MKIIEGILIDESSYSSEDTLDHLQLMSYIDTTPVNYMLESKKAINWLSDCYVSKDNKNKVLLDVGTGFGLFARRLFDSQENDNIIICNDIDKSNLEFVKRVLESSGEKKTVVFIACDLKSLPIKNKSIDILSSVGTSMLLLEKNESLVDHVNKYMKDSSELYLMESFYKKIDPNNKLALSLRDQLKKDVIDRSYQTYNYIKEHEYVSRVLGDGGGYEPLTKVKDEAYFYCLYYTR